MRVHVVTPSRRGAVLTGFLFLALALAWTPVDPIASPAFAQSSGGRVLRVGHATSAGILETMDPHARTGANIAYFENIMEPLVSFASERGDLRPLLAESWTANTDGTVWTLKLRRNVKFHDGSLFKAEAVKYALDRIYAIQQSPAFPLLREKVRSFTVVDDYTMRFTVNRAGPPLLHLLTMVLIVSPTAGAQNDRSDQSQAYFRDNAVGTGPYRLQRWEKRSLQALIRNQEYWAGWDGDNYTGIIYREIPEASTQQLMLERGELDVALTFPIPSLPALKRNADLTVQEDPGLRVWMMRMNMVAGPTRDVRVRKGLAHAFDYEGFLRTQSGITSPATGPVPGTFMRGWVPDNLPKFDLNRARSLLADAGVPAGTAFHILVASEISNFQGPASEILQAGLKRIGYDTKIDVRSVSGWFQEIINWSEKENADPARMPSNIFHLLVPPRLPDPWAFLWFNYHSDATRGSGRNWYQYRVPAVDTLIDRGPTESNATRRMEIYRQAARRIVEDQPDIWFANDLRVYVRRKQVASLGLHPSWAEGVRFYFTKSGN